MPQKLLNITIKEVSGVDHPANKRRFLVVKAAREDDGSIKDKADLLSKLPACQAAEQVKSIDALFSKTQSLWAVGKDEHEQEATDFNEELMQRQMGEMLAELSQYFDALWSSIRTILCSQEVDKPALIEGSLGQFHQTVASSMDQWITGMAEAEKGASKKIAEKIKATREVLEKMRHKRDPKRRITMSKLTKEQIEKLPADVRALVEAMQARVDELEKKASGGDPEPIDEDIWKGVHPKVRERLEKSERESADSKKRAEDAERVAKEEQDRRVTGEFIAKAKSYKGLTIEPAKFGPLLKRAFEKLAKEDYDELERILRAADKAIAEGKLFVELGSGRNGDGSVLAKVEAMVVEIRKADSKISRIDAMQKVFDENPELYEQHRKATETKAGKAEVEE